jgi:hypothetical protein
MVGVTSGHLALEDVAPVWELAAIVREPLIKGVASMSLRSDVKLTV